MAYRMVNDASSSNFFSSFSFFYTDGQIDKAPLSDGRILSPHLFFLLVAPSYSSLLPPRRSFLPVASFFLLLLSPRSFPLALSFSLLPPCSFLLALSSLLFPPRFFPYFNNTKQCSFHSESVNIVTSSRLTKTSRPNRPTDQPTDERGLLYRWVDAELHFDYTEHFESLRFHFSPNPTNGGTRDCPSIRLFVCPMFQLYEEYTFCHFTLPLKLFFLLDSHE